MPTFRRRKRLRPPHSLPKLSKCGPPREVRNFDVWLLRLSHLSQFGLFLFTAGAIYFTVIPLYQKALLDEAIAKKEVELKDVTASLESAYALVRAGAIKNFVFFAGSECTGLFRRPSPLPELGEPAPGSSPIAEKLFSIDVPACLTKLASDSRVLKDLRPNDRLVFDKHLKDVGGSVLALRQRAFVEYEAVPFRAVTAPASPLPPDSFTGRMLDYLASREPPEMHKKRVLTASIEAEKTRIATAYADDGRKMIFALTSIDWSTKN